MTWNAHKEWVSVWVNEGDDSKTEGVEPEWYLSSSWDSRLYSFFSVWSHRHLGAEVLSDAKRLFWDQNPEPSILGGHHSPVPDVVFGFSTNRAAVFRSWEDLRHQFIVNGPHRSSRLGHVFSVRNGRVSLPRSAKWSSATRSREDRMNLPWNGKL